jgi:hypothetical protein
MKNVAVVGMSNTEGKPLSLAHRYQVLMTKTPITTALASNMMTYKINKSNIIEFNFLVFGKT